MGKDKDTITSTIKLTVVKPLDGDWDKLGTMLRALRTPLHRALNATVRELELGWAVPGNPVHPQTASYTLLTQAWDAERQEAQSRIDAKSPYVGDDAIAKFAPSSALELGASGKAYTQWKKYRKESWKGTMSLPSFRGDSPIYVNGAGVRLYTLKDKNANKNADKDDKNYSTVILDIQLLAGRKNNHVKLVVQPCEGKGRGTGFAQLKEALSSEVKVGSVELVEKLDRFCDKKKWFVHLALTRPAPVRTSGRTVAVHRGVHNFLTCAISRSSAEKRDAYTEILETGGDVVAHKQAYAARRESLSRHGRELGTGAKGHGIERRHERVTRLQDAEANWVRSKCQEVAAHLFKRMERHGATRILLEDWTNPAKEGAPALGEHIEYLVRSFPLAQLRETIEWGAKKRGYTVDVVRTDHNSRDCPYCGHRHATAQYGKFLCEKCKLERNSDVIFAWNMLRRDGKTPGIEEANKATSRAVKTLQTATG